MHTGDYTDCEDLIEFEKRISSDLIKFHGPTYRDNVNHICNLINALSKNDANKRYSVRELGVMQGSSLATIMVRCFDSLESVIGIDIKEHRFQPYKHLFESFAQDKNFNFQFMQCSSLERQSVGRCDILHIDSRHTFNHLKRELDIHSDYVRKYIVIHDTLISGMSGAINDYINSSTEWEIEIIVNDYPGYQVLKRIK